MLAALVFFGARCLTPPAALAQSAPDPAVTSGPQSSSVLPASAAPYSTSVIAPSTTVADDAPSSPAPYVLPTESQKLGNFESNAIGPAALAGSAIAGAIDQAADFPGRWGQGTNSYGVRVASNLGISLVTASSQYALGEALHEDTAYYRCACRGFLPRFRHAALSTVVGRRGADGHESFSVALAASPFIGPLVAANAWIPSHDGARLGLHMGEHNLMGQFAVDQAQEFLFGGPHTLSARLHHFFTKSSN
jgi:hypothetical protein